MRNKGYINLTNKQYNFRINILIIILLAVLFFTTLFICWQTSKLFKTAEEIDDIIQGGYIMLGDSIKAIAPPCFILESGTLGSLMVDENTIRASSNPVYFTPEVVSIERENLYLEELFNRIIQCESGWNPMAKNPSSTARGLFQVIVSSEKECEKGLGRQLNMFNEDDNLLCGKWLYEHGGTNHWISSKWCWGN